MWSNYEAKLKEKEEEIIDQMIDRDIETATGTETLQDLNSNTDQTQSQPYYEGLLNGLKFFQLREQNGQVKDLKSGFLNEQQVVDDDMQIYLKYKQSKQTQLDLQKINQQTSYLKRCYSSQQPFRPFTQQISRKDIDKQKNLVLQAKRIQMKCITPQFNNQRNQRIAMKSPSNASIAQKFSNTSLSTYSTLNMQNNQTPKQQKSSLKALRVPQIQEWQQVSDYKLLQLNYPVSTKQSAELPISKLESDQISSQSMTTINTNLLSKRDSGRKVNFNINIIESNEKTSSPKTSPKKKKVLSFKREKTKKIRVSELLGLPHNQFISKSQTLAHFEKINDPTDPLYLMKSNYYRNNFVQEPNEIKMFGDNPGRVVLSELINELHKSQFHQSQLSPERIQQIANVRDPLKFKHYQLRSTSNYYQYASGQELNVQDPLPQDLKVYSYNKEYFQMKLNNQNNLMKSSKSKSQQCSQRYPHNERKNVKVIDIDDCDGGTVVIKRLKDDDQISRSTHSSQSKRSRQLITQNGKRGGVFINIS